MYPQNFTNLNIFNISKTLIKGTSRMICNLRKREMRT